MLILSSCEDVIEVNLGEKNMDLYAVEAKITSDDNPYVILYKSLSVDQDTEFPGVSGASVVISDNGQPQKRIALVENSEVKGLYHPEKGISFPGEAGKEYTLTIEHDGVILSATEKLSRVEPIDSIQVRPSLRGDRRFLGVFTYGNETPGIGNYYKWDVYVNDSLLNNAQNIAIASDELVDGNYVASFEIFTDFHAPEGIEFPRKLNLGDTVYVKQTSISEFAYLYYSQLINQNFSGGLFSVPNANINGNITASDGKTVLGLLTAHDVSKSNSVIINEKMESLLRK
jgi:hypothetical protein